MARNLPAIEQFADAAHLAGGLYPQRIRALAELAIVKGDDWRIVLDCIIRNSPELFDKNEALRRQRKAKYQVGY